MTRRVKAIMRIRKAIICITREEKEKGLWYRQRNAEATLG
jgi:hypothetical protein